MTNKISYLEDGEFCIVKKDQIEFFDNDGSHINKKVMNLSKNEIDLFFPKFSFLQNAFSEYSS